MSHKKDKKNAFLLSALTVLSYSITGAILNIWLPFWISGDIHTVVAQPESLRQPINLIGLILLILFGLLLLIAIGAYWLDRFFGEKYFGQGSRTRWVLFGFLFALLIKIPDWIFPQSWWVLQAVFKFAGLFAAFFLARWIVPLARSSDQTALSK